MTAKIKFQDFLDSYVVDPTKFSLYNDCVYVVHQMDGITQGLAHLEKSSTRCVDVPCSDGDSLKNTRRWQQSCAL